LIDAHPIGAPVIARPLRTSFAFMATMLGGLRGASISFLKVALHNGRIVVVDEWISQFEEYHADRCPLAATTRVLGAK